MAHKMEKPYTRDMAQALSSLAKLEAYDIETVLCYHGGPISGNVKDAIADIWKEEG